MMERNIIGSGRTAEVYSWEPGKVLKLFLAGYPKTAVEREFHLAQVLNPMNFPKPKAYEILSWQERLGIVYDHIQGEDLLGWVLRTMDVEACATLMADLHRLILQNSSEELPSYKDFLRWGVDKVTSFSPQERDHALQQLEMLPEGHHLCHGDFHPGNILLQGEEAFVLDFMNVCKGPVLYDIARTVFLVQYTPIPGSSSENVAMMQFRKDLVDSYLQHMGVQREPLTPYLNVIHWARRGEAPEEVSIYVNDSYDML